VSKPTPRERLVADCRDTAQQVFATVSRSAGPELLSLDLTMGQFKAMAMVTMYGPQAVGELGRRLGISEPAASLLADRLVDLSLAVRERDPHDRRRTLVTATPAAEELAGRLRQGRREQFTEWLSTLSDDELDGLARGLHGLMRAAQEGEARAHVDAVPAGGTAATVAAGGSGG
jgi:DNA-binding MarR family transcriptional regulator